jgi:hypothetical protein
MSPQRPGYKERLGAALNATNSVAQRADDWQKVAGNRMAMLMDVGLFVKEVVDEVADNGDELELTSPLERYQFQFSTAANDGRKIVIEVMSGINCLKDNFKAAGRQIVYLLDVIDKLATHCEELEEKTSEAYADLVYSPGNPESKFAVFFEDPASQSSVHALEAVGQAVSRDDELLRGLKSAPDTSRSEVRHGDPMFS